MELASLVTIADWQGAYRAGAEPRDLLPRLAKRLADESPIAAWIARTDDATLLARIDALASRAATFADRTALQRAMPFFGVPFAVKDNIDCAGLPTTAACPAFARVPAVDAAAVARLLDAGAVCMGKTNLDQFATGLVGTRSPFGRPSSVFAADRISGGSSSGSAVVVGRGDVPFALGTDTAGSGRIPAGFNNIVGLKPTPGRVSARGVVPACRTLDCVSIFALTVEDAAAVLAVVEGADPDDPYSAFRPGPPALPAALRVGIPSQAEFHGDAGYPPAFEATVGRLAAAGHRAVPVDFAPLHAVADLLYGGPWVAERLAAVQELLDRQPASFDPQVRQVIETGRDHSAVDAFRGQYRLAEARQATAALWRQVDVLMVPTAPGHPRHADVDADPIRVNAQLGLYTNFVNLLGWSAVALPAGFTAGGLPFGVTFIGPPGADAALARFGLAWQSERALRLGATQREAAVPDVATGADLQAPDIDLRLPWPASAATLPIAVVGAHLAGLPLNHQLTERGAVRSASTLTAPHYRLYALPGTEPPKPGMLRVASEGAAIEVEVWELPTDQVGSFMALVPAPLAIGRIELDDGRWVHGFVCEAQALQTARDITAHGGWRRYLATLAAAATP